MGNFVEGLIMFLFGLAMVVVVFVYAPFIVGLFVAFCFLYAFLIESGMGNKFLHSIGQFLAGIVRSIAH